MKALTILAMVLTIPFSNYTVANPELQLPTGNMYVEEEWLVADTQNPEDLVQSVSVYDMRGTLMIFNSDCGNPVCSTSLTDLSAGTYVGTVKGSLSIFSDQFYWGG